MELCRLTFLKQRNGTKILSTHYSISDAAVKKFNFLIACAVILYMIMFPDMYLFFGALVLLDVLQNERDENVWKPHVRHTPFLEIHIALQCSLRHAALT